MLKRHKSFDLNKDRGQRKFEQVKEPKKCKYLKYLIIPVGIAFILLCILMNLKLSKEEYDRKALNATGDKHQENATTSHNISHKNSKVSETKGHNENVLLTPWVPAAGCTEYKDNCTLFCTDGSVSYIDENLDELQVKCKGTNLNLILENCQFILGILRQSFFVGYFALEYLAINKCNLQTIEDPAFKHQNVKDLKTLILKYNQLVTFKATTFEGLSNLKSFEFIQDPLNVVFKGEQFLKPLANNLKEAIIQSRINGSEIMDPLKWWQEMELTSLTKLDMSNTNFQNALNVNTFHQFLALEYLILFNCNLLSIAPETFDIISNTLKYLDISFNHLKTLDLKFLENLMGSKSIEINLSLNEWHCECESEMLKYFLDHDDVKATEDLICLAPSEFEQMILADAVKVCKESKTTTIITTITITDTTTSSNLNTETSSISSTSDTSSEIPITTSENLSTFSTQPYTNTTSNITNTSTSLTESITSTTTSRPMTSLPPFVPPNLITINCTINENSEKFTRYITKPIANFSIKTTSPTTLTISVQTTDNFQKFSIIYFTNYTDYIDAFETQSFRTISAKVYIKDLKSSLAYVLCFVQESALRVSPFDCKSHFMGELLPEKMSWLLKSDKIWFFTGSFIAAIILFFLSIFIVYLLLRYNPRWLLYRNKRVLQVHNNSREVLVLSRKLSINSIFELFKVFTT